MNVTDIQRIQQLDAGERRQEIGNNIYQVVDGDSVHQDIDISKEEMDEFIGTMTTQNLEDITQFFESMPKLTHEVSVKNPNTGKTGKVVLEGFQSFFA